MEKKSFWSGLILGAIAVFVLFTLTISIACAINGVTFMEQVVAWFAPKFELIEKVVA